MHKLLSWLSRDDVARTNAAQASVRLQHRRHDRDDTNAFLTQHAKDHEYPSWEGVPVDDRHTSTVAPGPANSAQRETCIVSISGQPSTSPQPPEWAVDQATNELYDVDDPALIAEHAWELARAAQERNDERHDEYDDPDEGGEA